MPDFAYTTVPGKIPALLEKIRNVGVPSKVTVNWMKSVGFTSSNDSTLVPVLKQIEFIDGANTPTSAWQEYRKAEHAVVLARQIRRGYAGVFDIYDDANSRSQGEVEKYIHNKFERRQASD